MMKAFKIFCLISLSGIVGAGQARAGDWTLKGFKYGYCGVNDNATISYNGLNNSTMAGMNQTVFYSGDGSYSHGVVTKFEGSLYAWWKGLACTYYQSDVSIPSYTKLIKVCTFKVVQSSSKIYVNTSLSAFDTEDAAVSTNVIAAPYSVSYPAECFLDFYYTYKDGVWRERNGYASFTYDNSGGASAADMSKFITMMVATDNGNSKTYTYTAWSSLLQTAETDMWYYYKYITFDANGGTGWMGGQTLENSGTIPANSFVRDFHTFKGWNTQSDGKGTAYADGSVITATSADKGPVTLYAQWDRMGICVTVSEAGYATVYSDKTLIVPADVEVYGFTYSGGNLVQSAVISPGAVLHANQGYLVKAAAGTYKFALTSSDATAPESVLIGSTVDTDTPEGNIYVWGKPEGYDYGFYKYTGAGIEAGRAYYVKQD